MQYYFGAPLKNQKNLTMRKKWKPANASPPYILKSYFNIPVPKDKPHDRSGLLSLQKSEGQQNQIRLPQSNWNVATQNYDKNLIIFLIFYKRK